MAGMRLSVSKPWSRKVTMKPVAALAHPGNRSDQAMVSLVLGFTFERDAADDEQRHPDSGDDQPLGVSCRSRAGDEHRDECDGDPERADRHGEQAVLRGNPCLATKA